jgi:hypothetical protein
MQMTFPEWHEIKDSLLCVRSVPMIEADMPTSTGQPYAITTEDLKNVDVAIIGAPSQTNCKTWPTA